MRKKSNLRQIFFALVCGLAVIGGLAYFKYVQISKAIAQAQSFALPPDAVTTAVVDSRVWQDTIPAIGTLSPVQGTTLSAQNDDAVVSVNVDSGQHVDKGTVLVELDTSVEAATLIGVRARADKAKKALDRYKGVKNVSAISADVLDSAESEYRQADAAVRTLEATIAKKHIRAPFSGIIGIRLVNVGQYVSAGTPLIPLQALDPIYVDFSVPQQQIASMDGNPEIELSVDAFPGEKFHGKVMTVNPQINLQTRTLDVRALLKNPDERLRPGMFANVTVILPKKNSIVAIPTTSVAYAPYGDTVFVLETMKDKAGADYLGVRSQVVQLGEKRGDLVRIVKGLEPGQKIVTSGLFKLRPGGKVVENNSVAPGSAESPTPANT